MRPVLAAALLSVAACNTPYNRLTSADRAPFDRCRAAIEPAVCMGDHTWVCDGRIGRAADEYGRLPRSQRTSWLVGHGCPESVATYGQTSGGSATATSSRTTSSSGPPPPPPLPDRVLAVRAASRHHACAEEDIEVQTEHDDGGRPAFWLYVCGTQRYYRRELGVWQERTPAEGEP